MGTPGKQDHKSQPFSPQILTPGSHFFDLVESKPLHSPPLFVASKSVLGNPTTPLMVFSSSDPSTMGNRRRHWLPTALLILLSVGVVLGQHDSTFDRLVQRRKSLTQTPEQGLGRRLVRILKESQLESSTSAMLPNNLMEGYFIPSDDKMETALLFATSSTQNHNLDLQHSHQARGLRLRPKRKWSDAGKGGKSGTLVKSSKDSKMAHHGKGGKSGKSGNLAKSSKNNKIAYHGKETNYSWGKGKGQNKHSKNHSKTKGSGKGHKIGPFYKTKSKSQWSKSAKGKGGSKKSKTKKRTAIISEKELDICSGLDFRVEGDSIQSNGNEEHGKGKRRDLERIERSLPSGGELCKLNVFDVISSNANLSIFVELIEAAELEDIFLCAGKAKMTLTKL